MLLAFFCLALLSRYATPWLIVAKQDPNWLEDETDGTRWSLFQYADSFVGISMNEFWERSAMGTFRPRWKTTSVVYYEKGERKFDITSPAFEPEGYCEALNSAKAEVHRILENLLGHAPQTPTQMLVVDQVQEGQSCEDWRLAPSLVELHQGIRDEAANRKTSAAAATTKGWNMVLNPNMHTLGVALRSPCIALEQPERKREKRWLFGSLMDTAKKSTKRDKANETTTLGVSTTEATASDSSTVKPIRKQSVTGATDLKEPKATEIAAPAVSATEQMLLTSPTTTIKPKESFWDTLFRKEPSKPVTTVPGLTETKAAEITSLEATTTQATLVASSTATPKPKQSWLDTLLLPEPNKPITAVPSLKETKATEITPLEASTTQATLVASFTATPKPKQSWLDTLLLPEPSKPVTAVPSLEETKATERTPREASTTQATVVASSTATPKPKQSWLDTLLLPEPNKPVTAVPSLKETKATESNTIAASTTPETFTISSTAKPKLKQSWSDSLLLTEPSKAATAMPGLKEIKMIEATTLTVGTTQATLVTSTKAKPKPQPGWSDTLLLTEPSKLATTMPGPKEAKTPEATALSAGTTQETSPASPTATPKPKQSWWDSLFHKEPSTPVTVMPGLKETTAPGTTILLASTTEETTPISSTTTPKPKQSWWDSLFHKEPSTPIPAMPGLQEATTPETTTLVASTTQQTSPSSATATPRPKQSWWDSLFHKEPSTPVTVMPGLKETTAPGTATLLASTTEETTPISFTTTPKPKQSWWASLFHKEPSTPIPAMPGLKETTTPKTSTPSASTNQETTPTSSTTASKPQLSWWDRLFHKEPSKPVTAVPGLKETTTPQTTTPAVSTIEGTSTTSSAATPKPKQSWWDTIFHGMKNLFRKKPKKPVTKVPGLNATTMPETTTRAAGTTQETTTTPTTPISSTPMAKHKQSLWDTVFDSLMRLKGLFHKQPSKVVSAPETSTPVPTIQPTTPKRRPSLWESIFGGKKETEVPAASTETSTFATPTAAEAASEATAELTEPPEGQATEAQVPSSSPTAGAQPTPTELSSVSRENEYYRPDEHVWISYAFQSQQKKDLVMAVVKMCSPGHNDAKPGSEPTITVRVEKQNPGVCDAGDMAIEALLSFAKSASPETKLEPNMIMYPQDRDTLRCDGWEPAAWSSEVWQKIRNLEAYQSAVETVKKKALKLIEDKHRYLPHASGARKRYRSQWVYICIAAAYVINFWDY